MTAVTAPSVSSSEHASRIADVLRVHDHILVAAHAHPDGDALGSTSAMGWLLRRLGKTMALYNGTGAPDFLEWLQLPGPLYTDVANLPFQPELLVVLDCGDAHRVGEMLSPWLSRLPVINIDHHLGNPVFGTLYNWVDPAMAATGQMVAAVARALNMPLSGSMAEALYLALVTDTGGFAFGNTTAEVFRLAAELAESGLDVAGVRERLENQWTLARMRLWSSLLRKFTLHRDGSVALVAVAREDLEACGARKDDMEGFVEHLRRLRGVLVAGLVREADPGRCKLSLRSSGATDVRAMAAVFGGGGHRNAAGATLTLPLDAAADAVLAVVDAALAGDDAQPLSTREGLDG